MKLANLLLLVGGAINALFVLFHFWLGWQIHQSASLLPGARVLMEILNGGGTLFIVLLALASLACTQDTLTTRLGHGVIVAAFALYGLRALAEIFMAVPAKPAVVTTCFATSALYLAIFVLARRASGPVPAISSPAAHETL